MKRLPLVLAGTAVLVAGTGAAVGAQRDSGSEEELRPARAVAARIPVPAAASPSGECHGDGTVGCWTVPTPVTDLAVSVSALLTEAAGAPATSTCDPVRVGTTGAPMQADACFVRVRFGDHGVFVFIDPLTERDAQGRARVVGSRYTVQAA